VNELQVRMEREISKMKKPSSRAHTIVSKQLKFYITLIGIGIELKLILSLLEK